MRELFEASHRPPPIWSKSKTDQVNDAWSRSWNVRNNVLTDVASFDDGFCKVEMSIHSHCLRLLSSDLTAALIYILSQTVSMQIKRHRKVNMQNYTSLFLYEMNATNLEHLHIVSQF